MLLEILKYRKGDKKLGFFSLGREDRNRLVVEVFKSKGFFRVGNSVFYFGDMKMFVRRDFLV